MRPAAGRVAVVDDDESVRRALSRLLGVGGLSAESFPSAKSFLDQAQREPFACIVLDIHLGGMSGLDLLERLRAEGREVPVVIITAHDDQASRDRACRGGAAAYLRKPIDAQVLLDAVHRAMEGSTGC